MVQVNVYDKNWNLKRVYWCSKIPKNNYSGFFELINGEFHKYFLI